MKIYRVEYTFDDSYNSKTEGIKTVTLNVKADSNVDALYEASNKLSNLYLGEPKSFNVHVVGAVS